ncbi:MAG: hypothetical protein AB1758_19005, partial [Candidatus Eremiobacterota bacterium]
MNLCAATLGPVQVQAPPSYRFADRYTRSELLHDPERARAFVLDYLDSEAVYFRAARDPDSGLTFDGLDLDALDGHPTDVRFWSAPSKECLDLGVLVKALGGHPDAARVVSPGRPEQAADRAADILRRKMDSYQRFHRQQPGYGGFLPWFYGGTDLHPTPDWQGDCPGLDNGEWVWTMLVAEKALRDAGYAREAQRYSEYNQMLQRNAVRMFYDPAAGKVRGDVHIVDPYRADTEYRTNHGKPGRADYLSGEHGVHEGMMLVLYVTLFGQGLPEGAERRIWDGI